MFGWLTVGNDVPVFKFLKIMCARTNRENEGTKAEMNYT